MLVGTHVSVVMTDFPSGEGAVSLGNGGKATQTKHAACGPPPNYEAAASMFPYPPWWSPWHARTLQHPCSSAPLGCLEHEKLLWNIDLSVPSVVRYLSSQTCGGFLSVQASMRWTIASAMDNCSSKWVLGEKREKLRQPDHSFFSPIDTTVYLALDASDVSVFRFRLRCEKGRVTRRAS